MVGFLVLTVAKFMNLLRDLKDGSRTVCMALVKATFDGITACVRNIIQLSSDICFHARVCISSCGIMIISSICHWASWEASLGAFSRIVLTEMHEKLSFVKTELEHIVFFVLCTFVTTYAPMQLKSGKGFLILSILLLAEVRDSDCFFYGRTLALPLQCFSLFVVKVHALLLGGITEMFNSAQQLLWNFRSWCFVWIDSQSKFVVSLVTWDSSWD